MKRTKIMKIAMVLALTTLIAGFTVGCNNAKVDSTINDSNITTESEKTDNEDSVASTESETVESNNIVEEENEDIEVQNEELTLYSKDVNTDEEVVLGSIIIDETKTVDEKIDTLAQELSKIAFNELPIELVEIAEVDGKKVAVFNLNEEGNNSTESDYSKYEGISWFNNHFQGSTGGNITIYTLNKTLLQGDHTGEWIDGVKFLYKGEPIVFEHVEALGNITYR